MSAQIFRQVPVGESQPQAVTVGIESAEGGGHRAAIWWEAVGDVDGDEADYDDVPTALAAAEAARALHGLSEVVVALQEGIGWDPAWGQLQGDAGLSDDESFALAADMEAERDA